MNGPLVAFFAHPDDETFTSAGVMAAAVERGMPVTVITATRGEAGGSGIPGLDDADQLGSVREQELRDAMRMIGVTDVRWLGYRDSGLEDASAAAHPLAFTRIPVADVAATLASQLRELRPHVLLTFGPEGLYGHPDHLHAHEVALQAVQLAADPHVQDPLGAQPWQTPYLYFTAFPREEMQAMLERGRFDWLSLEARARIGTPMADITHSVDIAPWADRKRAAIASHQTQTGPGGPLSDIPPDAMETRWRREHFVRVLLPWSTDVATDDMITILAKGSTAS